MGKLNFVKFVNDVQAVLTKHSPEILTGIGIAGMITTTVLAVKATPKALQLIEEKKKEQDVEKLTPVETVKTTWKCYIPAAVTGVTGVGCLIGASSVNARRMTALTTAYKLSETALTEYKDKVIETVGEKKEKTIREKVAEKQVMDNPVKTSEVVMTGNGDTRFYDPMSGRHFTSNLDKVKKAENNLNNEMLHSITGYSSLNEFYDEIGLPHMDIGDQFGWNAENLIKIDVHAIVDDDGNPTIVLDYVNRPDYNYYK
jgi:hypothetical protein